MTRPRPTRNDNLTRKPKTRKASEPMGAGTTEDFDPRAQPAPDPKFRGCGCGFLFQPVGDPHPTRNLVSSLFYTIMIKI
jgi:hypothetical protein